MRSAPPRQALLVRNGCAIDSGKLGTLNPQTVVRVLEERVTDDGARRVNVSSLAGSSVEIVAALNEYNHCVQRFPTAADYQAARTNYCEVRDHASYREGVNSPPVTHP